MAARPLSEARAADRVAMIESLTALAGKYGWDAQVDVVGPRESHLHLNAPQGGLRVVLEFDGGMAGSMRDNHCLAWNSNERLSDRFGLAAGSTVNQHHRCKCTAFASGFANLHYAVERAMTLAASGEAFEAQP